MCFWLSKIPKQRVWILSFGWPAGICIRKLFFFGGGKGLLDLDLLGPVLDLGSRFFGGSGHFYWFFPVFLKNYIDMLAVLTSLKCYAKCWGWNPIDVVPIETERFKG